MKTLAALVLCLSLGMGVPAVVATPARTVALCGGTPQATTPKSFATKPAVGTKMICTVMKHEFTVKADTQFSVYKGRYYGFCCPGCKPKFDKNPAQYAGN